MREAMTRIYAARQLPASRRARAGLCFDLLVKRGCGAVRPFVELTGDSVLRPFESAANRSDRRRRWIVPALLLLSLVYGSPVIAEAYRPELGPTLRQLDKSVDAILTFQSRAGAQGARKGLPDNSCVYEIPGASFEFGKLVSMMVSSTFALGSENSFGALPSDNFESNISIIFSKAGHELLAFYFDDRADQLGVKGQLIDRFYGQVRYYKMREMAAFPKDLRELARRFKVTERNEGGC